MMTAVTVMLLSYKVTEQTSQQKHATKNITRQLLLRQGINKIRIFSDKKEICRAWHSKQTHPRKCVYTSAVMVGYNQTGSQVLFSL